MPPVVVHHMAALDGRYPPNSLESVVACLDAAADVIEVDITALADRDYLLVHEPQLEAETTGRGPVALYAANAVDRLRVKWRDQATSIRVPRLGDVVQAFGDHSSASTTLQLDLKDVVPAVTDERLRRLLGLIEPLGRRVLVSTNADWQLRRLRELAPWLALGLDIHFYLDVRDERAAIDPRVYPRRLGAYGYWDDHPVASRRVWTTPAYLADRCGALVGLVRDASTFYVSHDLLIRSLDDGFNWAKALHDRGIKLDAWTLDTTDPRAPERAARLRAAGVDQFTTNTPNELREILRSLPTSP